MEPEADSTQLLVEHLKEPLPNDYEWIKTLDELFRNSIYIEGRKQPFHHGPDGLVYYGFRIDSHREGKEPNSHLGLAKAIEWGTGGVIQLTIGSSDWVYTPGQIISLAVYGTTLFNWVGAWGEDIKIGEYRDNGPTICWPPPADLIHPLYLRCLEAFMRRAFKSIPTAKERVPAIALIRPQSRTGQFDASELILNAYASDFPNEDNWKDFQSLVRYYLPTHVSRRLLSLEMPIIPPEKFTPLEKYFREAGLEPIPET